MKSELFYPLTAAGAPPTVTVTMPVPSVTDLPGATEQPVPSAAPTAELPVADSPVPSALPEADETPAPQETEDIPEKDAEPIISVGPTKEPAQSTVTLPSWGFFALCGLIAVLAVALIASLIRSRKLKTANARNASIAPEKAAYLSDAQAQSLTRKTSHSLLIANTHNIGRREEQQDYFGISNAGDEQLVKKHGVLAVLADGMGGMSGGAQISQLVVGAFLSGFPGNGESDLLDRLTADAQKAALNFLDENLLEGGSTLVAVWLKGNAMRFVSVGDSRLCLIRNGVMTKLNKEHNYGAQLDALAEKGHISFEEAQNDPQRAALTSYIGKPGKLEINLCRAPTTILPGDRLVLMSDGIFNTLTDDEIVSALGDGLDSAALEAAVLAKARRNQDNFTAVLLQLT